jgi:DNA-binding SARP family transcriptional activator
VVDVEFRVLGRLDVSHDGERLDVGASKQRAVLAALLVSPNEPISSDRLMESVWWTRPSAAGSNLRMYLSGLRRALRVPGEGGSRLRTLRAGRYQLCVEPGELDLDLFNGLVEQGEHALRTGRKPAAADCLERALRLWSGRTLDGVTGGPGLQAKMTLLEERRIGIAERWARLRLEMGQAEEIVGELRALVGEHPLRERLWGYLMVALCRSGRPGEALAAYALLRTGLATELGVDPGPELQRLHQQILRGADWLAPGHVEGSTLSRTVTVKAPSTPPDGRGGAVRRSDSRRG